MIAHHRSGFTLIEIAIVIAIIGVLAGVLIQYITISTDDAKRSTLIHDLYVLRAQIEMYKLNHSGAVPVLQNNSLPQLVSASDSGGNLGAPGPAFPYGPYISGGIFPPNPFDQLTFVTAVATFPPSSASTAGGWLYFPLTGQIAANTSGHLND